MKGQSLVELAISIVVLMFLLSGAVEFGTAFFQKVQLQDAAQEGAMYGSMYPDQDVSIRAKASSNSPIDMVNDPNVTVETTFIDMNGLPQVCLGDHIKVKIIYQHKILMPFLPKILGSDTITISASAVNTIFNPYC